MISVIIKSYNRPWLLGVCLESVAEYLIGSRQVIVADDGTDGVLWAEARRRFGHLADTWIRTEDGVAKWPLARAGRFTEVVPTCGRTWNAAQDAAECETILLLEDDSYLTRPLAADACVAVLHDNPEILCLIGLRERCLMEAGDGPIGHGPGAGESYVGAAVRAGTERFLLRRHPSWPWSFAGHAYRRADWTRMGPWPEGVATGPMEGFVQRRLAETGWMSRPYGVALEPWCRFDWQTSCRTDHPSTYAGRFRHVDACNRAWLTGEFVPTFRDVRLGRFAWGCDSGGSVGGPWELHYPRALRQINFVTGHELCGELSGAEADARWLSQANQEAARYGEAPQNTVPDECRSAP